MAVTKVKKKTALAALTSAALSLPGVNSSAAVPSANIIGNFSYGHYEESDNRMRVDVYHADFTVPLTDRIELAFSIDKDIYSGATPVFSLPVSLTGLMAYDFITGKLKKTDLVSAASGTFGADKLTFAGGLETFEIVSELRETSPERIANFEADRKNQIEIEYDSAVEAKTLQLNQDKNFVDQEYQDTLANISSELSDLNTQFQNDLTVYQQQKSADLATYNFANPEPNSIKSAVTVDFGFNNGGTETVLSAGAYYGKANAAPLAGGVCPGGDCVQQNGMIIGTIVDRQPNTHLHRGGIEANRALSHHADAGGIYIRALDSSAFSLDSLKLNSSYSAANPYARFLGDGVTPNPNHDAAMDYFEILGFNTASNPDLYLGGNTGNGKCTDYMTCVAYQTIYNGFSGTLLLNNQFRNIKAAWIHYAGVTSVDSANFDFDVQVDDIKVSPIASWIAWDTDLKQFKAVLDSQYATLVSNRTAQYHADVLALNLDQDAIDQADDKYNETLARLDKEYQADLAFLSSEKDATLSDVESLVEKLRFQEKVERYRSVIDLMVPKGTLPVQRFAMQPMEARTMPQFTGRYFFDDTTLSFSGGLSDEPDFVSHFGTVNLSHEFNDKLTTLSGGYGRTSNTITRGVTHGGSDGGHSHAGEYAAPNYTALNETSNFDNFNLGISQVLSKNTLFQSSMSFSHQRGYLSNPYKYVYIRGEVTPEEYAEIETNLKNVDFDWNRITQLEMVGIELFRENRPRERNLWSISNRLNHHVSELDATVHLDYRFFTDDWGIDSHSFEFKWFQSLPKGLTITPNIRYYSQSQADFFAPYFLAPRADGFYSSDFRLSGFGNLSGGVTISKEYARGITLETGFEYTTHQGALKLGGGGVGDYADFDYFMVHANLRVDLSARPYTGGRHDHHMHHHHHGAAIPAGVMFGHMMNQANEFMVGYRYMYSAQDGAMMAGGSSVSDATLVDNACAERASGCLYKPTSMTMHMHMLDLMYSPTDWLSIMLMPQLMSMDMDMSHELRKPTLAEEDEAHGGSQHTSNELGDTIVMAMVKLLDQDNHHVHAGIGFSAPTGSIDAQQSPPALKSNSGTEIDPGSANLQDYGMQLGSGTWDFMPNLTYTGHWNDWGWGVQVSATKRLDKNKYGYALGDIVQSTTWGSYSIFNWLSATVRGAYKWQDKIHGETNQRHDTISPVDYPSNYGGRFWDVGFGLNVSFAQGKFAGHSLSVEWLQPVSTDFNGYQLERDGALSATWSFAF